MSSVKTVHVVFKTHLDIGFTDIGSSVLETYKTSFIPKAIELAEQMEGQFVWTTGSWLVDYYLTHAGPEERQRMIDAIRKGYIAWHGLPFTMHTEAVDSKLFESGLAIARRLDREFGKTTISAKMTDVPGHTVSMVSKLAANGIQYIHLGVNSSSKVPEVPPVFVWRNQDGSEVIVNYHDSYGAALSVDGLEDALVFAHTSDNHGPQTKERVLEIYETLRKRYPNAEVKASTLDAFAARLMRVKNELPVIQEEIGDSWIHGIASDPLKISKYRELIRLRDKWLAEGRLSEASDEYRQFSETLLLVPEHTWGVDTKRFLPDYVNWSKKDFQQARRTDIISEVLVPNKVYAFLGNHAKQSATENWRYSFLESSWGEENAYVDKAVQTLSEDKRAEAYQSFEQLQPTPHSPAGAGSLNTHETYRLGMFDVAFGDDGSLELLMDPKGKVWADEDNRLGMYAYQTFGGLDYQHWFDQYHVKMKQNQNWAVGDFGKPGIEYVTPKPRNRIFKPILHTIQHKHQPEEIGHADIVWVELRMPQAAAEEYGAPRKVVIEYRFHSARKQLDVELRWFNKDAIRMPEASWFSFVPKVENPNLWMADKLGQWVSPLTVVKGGNRSMHALETGARYQGADGKLQIETLDAPLVAFGEPRLVRFEDTFADLAGGLHFNLHNNVWGTNFRMWFEQDMKFRYRLTLEAY